MQKVKIISCFFSFPNFYTRLTRKKSHYHPLYDIFIVYDLKIFLNIYFQINHQNYSCFDYITNYKIRFFEFTIFWKDMHDNESYTLRYIKIAFDNNI